MGPLSCIFFHQEFATAIEKFDIKKSAQSTTCRYKIIVKCFEYLPLNVVKFHRQVLPPSSLTKSVLLNTILCTPAFPLPQEIFYPGNGSYPDNLSLSCSAITWYTTVQHHGILDEHLELCAFPPCRIWFVTCKQTPPRVRSLPQGVVYPESSSNRSRTFQLLLI